MLGFLDKFNMNADQASKMDVIVKWLLIIGKNLIWIFVGIGIQFFIERKREKGKIYLELKSYFADEATEILMGLPSFGVAYQDEHYDYLERHRGRIEKLLQKYDQYSNKAMFNEFSQLFLDQKKPVVVNKSYKLLSELARIDEIGGVF